MIKKILVSLNEPKSAADLLSSAITVARKFDAHIHALHVRPDSRDAALGYWGEPVLPSMVEKIISAADERAEKTASQVWAAFNDTCKKEGVTIVNSPAPGLMASASLEDVVGYESALAAARGRVSDLVIYNRGRGNWAVPRRIDLEEALIKTGLPVLVMPPKAPKAIGTRVAIAWNDTPPSARAVALAMDFITTAESVTILTVKERDSDSQPQALLELLDWHDVRAEVVQMSAGEDAGKTLLSMAAKRDANLLVMGAYGHARAREWVFGGVTKHVLEAAAIPALMVH